MYLELTSKDKIVARLSGIKTKTSGSLADTGSFESAGSETRTRMPVKAHAPETCASTNSAIPAKRIRFKSGCKCKSVLFFRNTFFTVASNFF